MKQIILYIILFLFIFEYEGKAQGYGEYRYFTLKFDFKHSLYSKHQTGEIQRFVNLPSGEEQLISKDIWHWAYKLSFGGGLLFNYDFQNDNTGIVTGIQLQNYAYKSKFTSSVSDSEIIEISAIRSLSFPLYLKLGRKIYKNQKYFTIGLQYNYNSVYCQIL